MIGPHEGEELELMLAGKKHLAIFHDAIPEDGYISEDIIPEQALAPMSPIIVFHASAKNMTMANILFAMCVLPHQTMNGAPMRSFIRWKKRKAANALSMTRMNISSGVC